MVIVTVFLVTFISFPVSFWILVSWNPTTVKASENLAQNYVFVLIFFQKRSCFEVKTFVGCLWKLKKTCNRKGNSIWPFHGYCWNIAAGFLK